MKVIFFLENINELNENKNYREIPKKIKYISRKKKKVINFNQKT